MDMFRSTNHIGLNMLSRLAANVPSMPPPSGVPIEDRRAPDEVAQPSSQAQERREHEAKTAQVSHRGDIVV